MVRGTFCFLDHQPDSPPRESTRLDQRPWDLGPAGQLWTPAGVADLIAKPYRVRLAGQGVGTYLRRWGPDVPAAG
nr:winged helix-turn-helix domain-containing protein [Streptomyces spinoverrucosus]